MPKIDYGGKGICERSPKLAIPGEAEERKRKIKQGIQDQLREALKNAADTDDKNAIMMK